MLTMLAALHLPSLGVVHAAWRVTLNLNAKGDNRWAASSYHGRHTWPWEQHTLLREQHLLRLRINCLRLNIICIPEKPREQFLCSAYAEGGEQ